MNDEQKEKARERMAKARAVKAAKAPVQAVVEVADISGASPEDTASLLARIADLQGKLADSETKRSAEQQARLDQAKSQIGQAEEIPTGEDVEIDVIDEYEIVDYKNDGRPILAAKFKKAKIPTFFYKIDLPPCGGTDLKINGIPFYHGTTVTLDLNTLRTVKEMVYRCWEHDKSIHGSDENFYRSPKKQQISARGMR